MDLTNQISTLPKTYKTKKLKEYALDVPDVFFIVYGDTALLEYLDVITYQEEEENVEQYSISFT